MKVLAFDTETTGLVDNRVLRVERQPHIIEFYGCKFDTNTGEIFDELNLLIKPPRELSDVPPFGEKKTTTQITGITNEMLADKPSFKQIADQIFNFIEGAPLIAAHNLFYDKEMIEIEAQRLNYAISWPRGICTVEQTVHLKGHRLKLGDLYEHLFNEKFVDAHRAQADTQALMKCIIKLYKNGVI